MVTRSCLLTRQVYSFKTKTKSILSKNFLTSINASKTKGMLFRSTKSKTAPSGQSISLRKLDIEQVSSLKFLGVHIDEHLTWQFMLNMCSTN